MGLLHIPTMLGADSASDCASNTSLTSGVMSSLCAQLSTRPLMLLSSEPSLRYRAMLAAVQQVDGPLCFVVAVWVPQAGACAPSNHGSSLPLLSSAVVICCCTFSGIADIKRGARLTWR